VVRNISGEYWEVLSSSMRNWTLDLVRKMNSVSNKNSHAIDFLLDNILGGYITEIAVDCTQSYSVAERYFFKGLHERFIKSLGTWIKMFLCEKCVMTMDSDC
jgi:hypothetical protein